MKIFLPIKFLLYKDVDIKNICSFRFTNDWARCALKSGFFIQPRVGSKLQLFTDTKIQQIKMKLWNLNQKSLKITKETLNKNRIPNLVLKFTFYMSDMSDVKELSIIWSMIQLNDNLWFLLL